MKVDTNIPASPGPSSQAADFVQRVHVNQRKLSLEQRLLVVNLRGEILFATRKARILMNAIFENVLPNRVPDALQKWIRGGESDKPMVSSHPRKGEIENDQFSMPNGGNVLLLRIEKKGSDQGPQALLSLGLTAREAEVLYWIAEGKTNPEIAIILDAALNTVRKHAYNLFAKLGVETRTGAARLALGVLSS